MNTLVTIKAFKRPYYLEKVLDSIVHSIDSNKQKYMISLDFHPLTQDESTKLIEKYKKDIDIELIKQVGPTGCAGNMRFCFNYSFRINDYDAMIHIEDDTPVGKDLFLWSDWAINYMKDKDLFAASFFTRKISDGERTGDPTINLLKEHFDCGGGFCITRKQWEYIVGLKEIFGIVGPASLEAPPEEWYYRQQITDDGSWAWPFNRYYRRGKSCLYPYINRTNNIGDKEGRFNPGEDWHRKNIYVENWIESDYYKDIDLSKLNYKNPE